MYHKFILGFQACSYLRSNHLAARLEVLFRRHPMRCKSGKQHFKGGFICTAQPAMKAGEFRLSTGLDACLGNFISGTKFG